MKESKYVTIYKEWKEKIESGQIAVSYTHLRAHET